VNAKDWYGSNEGGFALTFNANPVLNFVGNMFNGTQQELQDYIQAKGIKNIYNK
jgi:hypothetical protein